MNLEGIRTYLLAKKGTTEDTPFGPETLVFKVMGKMFTLFDLSRIQFKRRQTDENN